MEMNFLYCEVNENASCIILWNNGSSYFFFFYNIKVCLKLRIEESRRMGLLLIIKLFTVRLVGEIWSNGKCYNFVFPRTTVGIMAL